MNMKTGKMLAVLIMMLPLACGCRNDEKAENIRTRFSLVRPAHDVYGNPCCTMRFNAVKEKDERSAELENVTAQWNRNLLLGSCPCRIEE